MTNTIIKVARLHLVDRFSYTWLVWGVLAFTFVVNCAIFAVIGRPQSDGNYTGALVIDLHLHGRHRGAGRDQVPAVRLHPRGEPADLLTSAPSPWSSG